MKNVVTVEHDYHPWEIEKVSVGWVSHYDHEGYHESVDNVTSADVYEGIRNEILEQRAVVKLRMLTRTKVYDLPLAG